MNIHDVWASFNIETIRIWPRLEMVNQVPFAIDENLSAATYTDINFR